MAKMPPISKPCSSMDGPPSPPARHTKNQDIGLLSAGRYLYQGIEWTMVWEFEATYRGASPQGLSSVPACRAVLPYNRRKYYS